MSELIEIEVAYAAADRQEVIRVKVARGTTVLGALAASGLEQRFPAIAAATPALGG